MKLCLAYRAYKVDNEKTYTRVYLLGLLAVQIVNSRRFKSCDWVRLFNNSSQFAGEFARYTEIFALSRNNVKRRVVKEFWSKFPNKFIHNFKIPPMVGHWLVAPNLEIISENFQFSPAKKLSI